MLVNRLKVGGVDLNLEPFESQTEFKLYSKEKGKVSQDLDQLKLPKPL